MPLGDSPPNLPQHRVRRPTPRPPADERDDTEVAREATAVLHLHERADTVERGMAGDARDRADVTRDRGGRLLARPSDDGDVVRQAGERIGGEVRGTAGGEDAAMRARRPGNRVT